MPDDVRARRPPRKDAGSRVGPVRHAEVLRRPGPEEALQERRGRGARALVGRRDGEGRPVVLLAAVHAAERRAEPQMLLEAARDL